MTNMYGRVIN